MEDKEDVLEDMVLHMIYSWGRRGITRETFYNVLRGLNYEDLKVALDSLEGKKYIDIEWTGLDRFFAYINDNGIEHLKSLKLIKEIDSDDRDRDYQKMKENIERI